MKNESCIQVVKYSIIAASAGIIQVISFSILEHFKFSYWPSYLIALVLSVLWNFTFNRKYTFQSATNIPKAMLLVYIYYLVFTPLSTYLGDVFAKKGYNHFLILAVTMLVNFVTEFLYQKFIVFKDTKS